MSLKPGQAWKPSEDKRNPNPFAGIVPNTPTPKCELQTDHFVGKSGFVAPTNSTEPAGKIGFGPPMPPPPPPPTPEEIASTVEIDPAAIIEGWDSQDKLPAEAGEADDTPDLETQLQIKEAALATLRDEIITLNRTIMDAQLKLVAAQDEIDKLKTQGKPPTGAGYDERGLKVKELEAKNAALEQQLRLAAQERPANVIEVRTLTQFLLDNRPDKVKAADDELAERLSEGFTVMNITITPANLRYVTLRRDPRPAPRPEQVVIDTDVDPVTEPKLTFGEVLEAQREEITASRQRLRDLQARTRGDIITGTVNREH